MKSTLIWGYDTFSCVQKGHKGIIPNDYKHLVNVNRERTAKVLVSNRCDNLKIDCQVLSWWIKEQKGSSMQFLESWPYGNFPI